MSTLTVILTIVEFALLGSLALICLAAVLLAVLIFITAIRCGFTNRRDLKFLSAFACPKCDHVLGREAVIAAQERHRRKVQESMKNRPPYARLVALRLAAPIWEIECPQCGFKILYHPVESRIEIPSSSPQAA